MLNIVTVSKTKTITFAAEELKRYLARMLDSTENIDVTLEVGRMQDFSLDVSDAEDLHLDDLVYICTNEQGGVIAGDNDRSVLFAVYEYLRQHGARWLFPGEGGEWIPKAVLHPVNYRHLATNRFRGPCIEGAESRELVLETIDFLPKVGMNLFMSQFFEPYTFYHRYYSRSSNTKETPIAITVDEVRAFKKEFVDAINLRGLSFHDVGHGWTAAPFGIDTSTGWGKVDDSHLSDEMRAHFALVNGRRGLADGVALNAQFCMSSEKTRKIVVDYIAAYAQKNQTTDFIHVWLGDNVGNHCQCEACVKKSPSDWYVIFLNELDRELTQRMLATRIVCIAYLETTWAPDTEQLEHPERFALMLAPITRSHTRTLTENIPALPAFDRKNIILPKDLDTYMGYFADWKKIYSGSAFCFEYHFWIHQVYDPSGLYVANRIFEDAKTYTEKGLNGMIACGTQRAYFPTGLAYYVFARKQYDGCLSFDEIKSEYFSSAFGKFESVAREYLSGIADAFGPYYLEGEESTDLEISKYYNPKRAELLGNVKNVTAKLRETLVDAEYENTLVAESFRILLAHAEYCELLADVLIPKANGDRQRALLALAHLQNRMSELEQSIEINFELDLTFRKLKVVVESGKGDVAIDLV